MRATLAHAAVKATRARSLASLGMSRGAGLALLMALLSNCTSSEKKAQDGRAQLVSWNATLRLLARERSRGALPEPFAQQVRRAAAAARDRAEAQLRQARSP